MGLISNLIRSNKKTKLMKKLINCVSYSPNPEYSSKYISFEDAELIKREFYNFISNDQMLGSILKKYKVTYEMFENILERYLALGYNYWEGTNHIPVSLFSFAHPLNYIMSNKEVFEKKDNYNEVIEICYNSKQILKEMYY